MILEFSFNNLNEEKHRGKEFPSAGSELSSLQL
jgi:hypothetical protein